MLNYLKNWKLTINTCRVKTIVTAQSALAAYRAESKSASIKSLSNEAHHPTSKLAKFLRAIGEPKPTVNHEAHHIVAGSGRFNSAAILRARLNLHIVGLGINDPTNGTWLINFQSNKGIDWATEQAPANRKLHRYNYETWVGRNLGLPSMANEQRFISILRMYETSFKHRNVTEHDF